MPISASPLDLTGTGYCASFNFRRAARAVTRLYDLALQESGIRSTQFTILVGIAKSQPVSVGTLGEILLIDRTTLARSLQLLRKERLISISARSTMRQRFLAVTRKGEHALSRSLPIWRKIQGRFVQAVGSCHWLELRDELERLAAIAMVLEDPKNSGRERSQRED